MSDKVLGSNQEKFFFNMNIFDEDHEDESDLEEEIPPPPTFSEEELDAARKKAFEEGRQQGIREERASREQQVANAVEVISQNMNQIIAEEIKRAHIFEQESLRLNLAIFKKLFPLYNAQHGEAELQTSLKEVLDTQLGPHEISVSVSPDVVQGVEDILSTLSSGGLNAKFKVTGDENTPQTACALSWTDGGAIIDREETAQKILSILEQKLAGSASKGHDEENKDNTTAQKDAIIEEKVEKPDE